MSVAQAHRLGHLFQQLSRLTQRTSAALWIKTGAGAQHPVASSLQQQWDGWFKSAVCPGRVCAPPSKSLVPSIGKEMCFRVLKEATEMVKAFKVLSSEDEMKYLEISICRKKDSKRRRTSSRVDKPPAWV